MYNGIGLQTARGTGTNGYVQKNLSYVRITKEKVDYKTDDDLKKIESYMNRKGNAEIIEHERKRKIELKCIEMQDLMAEEGYTDEEIARKVEKFRRLLTDKDEKEAEAGESKLEYDSNGRPMYDHTFQISTVCLLLVLFENKNF
jgi:hypothetical protein